MQPSEQLWCERQRVWEREQQLSWARLKVRERESSKSGASLGWLPSVALSNSTRQQQKQMVIRAEINNSKNNIKQQLFTLFCVQLFSLSGWKNKGSGGDIVSYLCLYLQLLLCASVCSACVCVCVVCDFCEVKTSQIKRTSAHIAQIIIIIFIIIIKAIKTIKTSQCLVDARSDAN